jgi:ribosomal protein S4E
MIVPCNSRVVKIIARNDAGWLNCFSDIVTVKDAKGQTFGTRLQNVFIIGSGSTPQITIPKRGGIKKIIIEERAEAEAAGRI